MPKQKLIGKFLSFEKFKNDINSKFKQVNGRFNKFDDKSEMVNFNLSILRRCNELPLERITQLERNNQNNQNNGKYNRRETLEINSVPSDIGDDVLGQSVWQALLLTGVSVEPKILQACHRMRRKDRVIVKFKCRKQKHHVLL